MLLRLPPELIDTIAFTLVAHTPLGPPAALLPLLLTHSSLHVQLTSAPFLARIARLKLDTAAVTRRLFCPAPADLAEHLVHACRVLQALRAGDVSDLDVEDTLASALLLMLDNDGRNYAQLRHAGVHAFVERYVRLRLWEGREQNFGWPLHTKANATALWLLWLTTERTSLLAEDPTMREQLVMLLLPFVVCPHLYPSSEAPPNHFRLPLPYSTTNPAYQPPLVVPLPNNPTKTYPHYLPPRYTSQVYFRARPNLTWPLASLAAKLLFVARRELRPIVIPAHIPPGPGVPGGGLTQADYRELNASKAAELPRGAIWDWERGVAVVVNRPYVPPPHVPAPPPGGAVVAAGAPNLPAPPPLAAPLAPGLAHPPQAPAPTLPGMPQPQLPPPTDEDLIPDHDPESAKWDTTFWRMRLCGDILAPRPVFAPGEVFRLGSMRGVWQGRIYIPQGTPYTHLLHQPYYPGVPDERAASAGYGLLTENSLGLVMQPIFLDIREHHRVCFCEDAEGEDELEEDDGDGAREEDEEDNHERERQSGRRLRHKGPCGVIPVPKPEPYTPMAADHPMLAVAQAVQALQAQVGQAQGGQGQAGPAQAPAPAQAQAQPQAQPQAQTQAQPQPQPQAQAQAPQPAAPAHLAPAAPAPAPTAQAQAQSLAELPPETYPATHGQSSTSNAGAGPNAGPNADPNDPDDDNNNDGAENGADEDGDGADNDADGFDDATRHPPPDRIDLSMCNAWLPGVQGGVGWFDRRSTRFGPGAAYAYAREGASGSASERGVGTERSVGRPRDEVVFGLNYVGPDRSARGGCVSVNPVDGRDARGRMGLGSASASASGAGGGRAAGAFGSGGSGVDVDGAGPNTGDFIGAAAGGAASGGSGSGGAGGVAGGSQAGTQAPEDDPNWPGYVYETYEPGRPSSHDLLKAFSEPHSVDVLPPLGSSTSPPTTSSSPSNSQAQAQAHTHAHEHIEHTPLSRLDYAFKPNSACPSCAKRSKALREQRRREEEEARRVLDAVMRRFEMGKFGFDSNKDAVGGDKDDSRMDVDGQEGHGDQDVQMQDLDMAGFADELGRVVGDMVADAAEAGTPSFPSGPSHPGAYADEDEDDDSDSEEEEDASDSDSDSDSDEDEDSDPDADYFERIDSEDEDDSDEEDEEEQAPGVARVRPRARGTGKGKGRKRERIPRAGAYSKVDRHGRIEVLGDDLPAGECGLWRVSRVPVPAAGGTATASGAAAGAGGDQSSSSSTPAAAPSGSSEAAPSAPQSQPQQYQEKRTFIAPTRREFDRSRIGVPCNGVKDIVITGETGRRHRGWQDYRCYGRVRMWDGLVGILRFSGRSETNSIFIFGYVVGEKNFVGEWRMASSDPLRPVWGGAFVMSKRRDAEPEA